MNQEVTSQNEKTILILGAVESFCDLITDIKSMGIKTVACDYYPDAPGKKVADYAYNLSTTDINAMVEIGKKHNIDGVICAFSDRNLYPSYQIAHQLGLPSFYTPEIIETLTDKIKMKNHLREHGFPILKYSVIHKNLDKQLLDDFQYPVIIKPVDNSGSKGVFVCNTLDEVIEKMPECLEAGAENNTDIIVEEYYPADEICITAWVKNGKAFVTCVYDVGKNYDDDIVTCSIIFPSKYAKTDLDKLSDLTQELTDSFHITEGPITIQCLIGNRGLKVNEYIFRLAGGSPYMFTEYLGGPNFAKMVAQYSIGQKINYETLEHFSLNTNKTVYQYRVYATKPGKIFYAFDEQSIKEKIPECTYFHLYSPSGCSFQTIPTDGKIIARLFCEVDDPIKEPYESFIDILEKIAIIYDENGENITTYNRPEKPVSYEKYDLKL